MIINVGGWGNGHVLLFTFLYHDIFVFDRLGVSLASLADGTRVRYACYHDLYSQNGGNQINLSKHLYI